MDFLTGFPSSKHGNYHVFAIVNRFSKLVLLAPCKNGIIAKGIAKFFFEHVWIRFDVPKGQNHCVG
jgi:hypothetical protein